MNDSIGGAADDFVSVTVNVPFWLKDLVEGCAEMFSKPGLERVVLAVAMDSRDEKKGNIDMAALLAVQPDPNPDPRVDRDGPALVRLLGVASGSVQAQGIRYIAENCPAGAREAAYVQLEHARLTVVKQAASEVTTKPSDKLVLGTEMPRLGDNGQGGPGRLRP